MSDDAVFNFHGLARVLAEQDLQTVRVGWLKSLARLGSFPFKDLPLEIAVAILKMATTKSSTYSALMRAGVKQLWFLHGLAREKATSAGPAIINACFNVERVACFPDVLLEMCSSPEFRHTSLVDVTLMEPLVPWERLLGSRHGTTLFNQIQTLRLVGGTQPVVPPHGTSFDYGLGPQFFARCRSVTQP
ncbi:hypothetical protein B0H13DRAFT_2282120 [Mycena leptocephala]|nr:hypothetical protein B0H13DRAFT_2282120 [Mycena leptocephala]